MRDTCSRSLVLQEFYSNRLKLNAGASTSTNSQPGPEPLLQFAQLPVEGHPTQAHAHARKQQKPEVMRLLTAGALLCGPGLPVRLFFDMDGVLISSRFFLENILRVPLPSMPTSLSLTYRPPTHPRTRHLCAPPPALRGSSVASRRSLIHGNCLSVCLLPLSHIEPRRLTDTQTRDHRQPLVRVIHSARSFSVVNGRRKRRREAALIFSVWMKISEFRRFCQANRNAKRAATHTSKHSGQQ